MNGTFHCSSCGAGHGSRTRHHKCPACGGALRFSLESLSFPRDKIRARPAHMWRYGEALPAFEERVSLGEPMTPLLPLHIGDLRVLAKCEFGLPSGSYKDRGAAVLMSYLRAVGVEEAVEDSSGNAGAAAAAYAARAGIRLKIFCPATAAAGKLLQIRLFNAELVRVEGPRPRATAALLDYVEESGAVYASHLWHPLFVEGVKTMAFEIVEQLGWTAPHSVVFSVGAGSIALGLYRGFKELRDAAVIPRLPRLIAVQARNVCPLYTAFREGADRVVPPIDPRPTLAEGLAMPAVVHGAEILEGLRESGGTVVAVEEEEIVAGVKNFGARGFCVEPTTAVLWSGLERAREEIAIPADPPAVLILSGHGLKATQSMAELL